MKKYALILLSLASLFLLCSCASGPRFSEMQSTIPRLKPDQGRVFLYRVSSPFGAMIQPDILIDGQVVGQSEPGGFFYVDLMKGNHEVATTTEVEQKLSFTLDAGQVRYVKTEVGLGMLVGRVQPYLVDEAEGKAAILELSYQRPAK